MRRAMVVLCGGLALAGCGDDECTAACKKVVECGSTSSVEQCTAECALDPGNAARARCVAAIPGCDEAAAEKCEDTSCTQAVAKINACMTANNPSAAALKYAGWCTDQAKLSTTTGTKTIAFLSWSKTYLACAIDPKTCRCPGQPWFSEL